MTTKRPENRLQAINTLERAKDFIPYPTVVETTHRGERTLQGLRNFAFHKRSAVEDQ